ncbi:MAG TPA: dTDP-4-dehydrorhamnose 3,5-epimerase [Burkholderiales bacterium]
MKFVATPLAGAFVVELEELADERGFFARSFCRDEFARHGLEPAVAQCNVSYNAQRGTLRGLHYQAEPHPEAKLVRCTRGAVWDVAVDLRPGSPTLHRWFALELTADNRRALYVPAGFAHGFQSLTDSSEVLYQMSESYRAELARGVRWDDPRLAIPWPVAPAIVSERDRALPLVGKAAR